MKVKYYQTFIKDLDNIERDKDRRIIERAINQLEDIPHIRELPNVKKLQGTDSAYRIRAGNYRIGFFLSGNRIEVARVAHRKDIYDLFP